MTAISKFWGGIKNLFIGKDFFTSWLYLAILATAIVVSWATGKLFVIAAVFGLAVVLVALTQKNLAGMLPIVGYLIYAYSVKQKDIKLDIMDTILTAVIFIAVCMVCVVVHLIKNRKNLKIGYFPKTGYLLLVAAALLGGVGAGAAFDLKWLGGVAIAVVMFLVLFAFTSSIRTPMDKEFLCRILVMLGVILMAQTLLFFYQAHLDGHLMDAINNKWLDYGWGVSNAGGMMLVMVVPAVFYYATKRKFPIVEALFFVALAFTLLMTSARGAQLAFAAIIIPVIIYAIVKAKNRKGMIATVVIGLIIAGGVLAYLFKVDSGFIEWWVKRGISDSGRFDIYEACIREMLSGNFLFGWGFFHGIPGIVLNNWLAHCSVLQFWNNFGLLGLAAFVVLTAQNYKTVFSKNGTWGGMMAFALLGAGLYGLIDNSHFTPYYTTMLMVIIVCASNVKEFRKSPVAEGAKTQGNLTDIQKEERLLNAEIPHLKQF